MFSSTVVSLNYPRISTGRIQVIKVDMYLSEIIISLGAILFRARPPISARFPAIARVNIDARGL